MVKHGDEPDPKLSIILHYLRNMGWLETHGSIIFSQYLDTALWVATSLAAEFPKEPVGLYAGHGNSFVYQGGQRIYADRELIKEKVKNEDIRLLVATDAACEGLNLQRLGSQMKVDMPWNPSRLEQRKGRIQRIGQLRDVIHVVNNRLQTSSFRAICESCRSIRALCLRIMLRALSSGSMAIPKSGASASRVSTLAANRLRCTAPSFNPCTFISPRIVSSIASM